MRVLHLSSLYPPHSVGGAERVVEMLAEGMAARGIAVAVAHLAPRPAPAAQRNGVQVHPLAHRNPLWIETSARHAGIIRKLNKVATLFNALTARDFVKALDEHRPDIVHSHSMVELTPRMWKAAKERGAAVVHTLHDYDLMCIRAALFKDEQRCAKPHLSCAAFSRVKRHYHRNIDHVVGVSRAILQTHLAQGFFSHIGEPHRHVIWNPVRAPAAPAAARCRAGPFTFGFLGRLVPEKGILQLLDACRLLEVPGWQLKVAGRAPADDSFLRERIGSLPVELLGYVKPADFFADIDMLIVPSVWLEPFGLTIVEAYAAGVPVLGADVAGVGEILGATDPTALFPVNDVPALAQKMETLVRDGRDALPSGDYSAVLERTDPDHVVGEYVDVYRRAKASNGA
jgi:glycosyltransferase involved in cell wall biosynthesis